LVLQLVALLVLVVPRPTNPLELYGLPIQIKIIQSPKNYNCQKIG